MAKTMREEKWHAFIDTSFLIFIFRHSFRLISCYFHFYANSSIIIAKYLFKSGKSGSDRFGMEISVRFQYTLTPLSQFLPMRTGVQKGSV